MDNQLIAGVGRDDRLSTLGDGVLGHILSYLATKERARAAVLSSRWRHVFASVHTVSMEEPEAPLPDHEDRLSTLGDGLLGHILSYLDTKAAARAAALSSRWRDVFASVHTVSMEEPEAPIPDYDDEGYRRRQPEPTPAFTALVNAALIARGRRPAPAAASPPLRALRVAMENYTGTDALTVDQWVTYALKHAAPELELHLRVRRVPVCKRPDPYERAYDYQDDGGKTRVEPEGVNDDDDVASSVDEIEMSWRRPPAVYTVPWQLLYCAALRSLSLASCKLSTPAAVSLPSLEALGLTHIHGAEEDVERLMSACPRLADLTVEACGTLTALSLLENTCLRRLALRCCPKLATVTVDASELQSFEYRGAVPVKSFLTSRVGFPSITSCKVDVCAVCLEKEATSEEELAAVASFLQPFTSTTKRLDLCAARMGSCFVNLPAFACLRHLQLNGRVLQDDAEPIAATCTILRQAPDLELLTLFFETAPLESFEDVGQRHFRDRKEAELIDAHHLHYNQYETLDYSPAASVAVPSCLGSRVRRINLAHYQGGRAQRTLARFLLRNAPVLDKLYCEFAEGPMLIQTKLKLEMEGWVLNDKASKEFY